MAGYEPSSRRPIAAVFRAGASGAVDWCVRRGVAPDAISYLSVVAAGAAGALFWRSGEHPWLLLIAPAPCYLRLWFNMLDGMVAIAAGKASRRGEIVNELPDRVSDLAIFVGVAHSGLCSPLSGYWAAIAALLTAYVGVLAQAIGGRRGFGGIMSKPWRMVTLHAGAWAAWLALLLSPGGDRFLSLTVLDWTCVAIVAGCVQTVFSRLVELQRDLGRVPASHDDVRGGGEHPQ